MAESMRRVDVLDKGHVDYIDHMGSDITVVNAARVSFNTRSEYELDMEGFERIQVGNGNKEKYKTEFLQLSEKDEKLIRYLAAHNHWTPFGHPQITLRIKAPVSIRTQFFKHKQGFVENEISRRYVSTEPEFYTPQWRGKPSKGAKQGSSDFIDVSSKSFNSSLEKCHNTYNQLIKEGVAPEQARFILPQGMYTEWYWSGTLMAFARVCNLRCKPDAQKETQMVADQIDELAKNLFPNSWKALRDGT